MRMLCKFVGTRVEIDFYGKQSWSRGARAVCTHVYNNITKVRRTGLQTRTFIPLGHKALCDGYTRNCMYRGRFTKRDLIPYDGIN